MDHRQARTGASRGGHPLWGRARLRAALRARHLAALLVNKLTRDHIKPLDLVERLLHIINDFGRDKHRDEWPNIAAQLVNTFDTSDLDQLDQTD